MKDMKEASRFIGELNCAFSGETVKTIFNPNVQLHNLVTDSASFCHCHNNMLILAEVNFSSYK